jgi:ketosteroid isomerase-like protein
MDLSKEARMNMARRVVPLVVAGSLLAVGGCGEGVEEPSSTAGGTVTEGILVSDARGLLRAELEQADREFARNVRDAGLDAWVDAFAENGLVLPADGPVATGRSAIRSLFEPLFAKPGFEITWSPMGAEVAASGDLGYTYGDWRTSMAADNEEVTEAQGKYVTVWHREPGGRWQVLLDIGNTQGAAIQRN